MEARALAGPLGEALLQISECQGLAAVFRRWRGPRPVLEMLRLPLKLKLERASDAQNVDWRVCSKGTQGQASFPLFPGFKFVYFLPPLGAGTATRR